MKNSAPVVLLFDKLASEISGGLSELIGTDDELFHYEGGVVTGPARRLLHQGIEYSVSTGTNSVDTKHFGRIFCDSNLSTVKAALTLDLGGNVAGGQLVAPIALNLLMFAAKLATAMGAVAIAWTPSKLLSDVSYFVSTVESYSKGGAFPVLSTIKLEFVDDALRTTGLGWFTGQELELKGEGLSQAELMRRAVRIAHDIATNGPVMVSQDVPDLDGDRLVRLSLSSDGDLVFAEIISDLERSPV